jgi:hypothetical protein
MPIIPPTNSLQAIETKVRRLTRSPSEAQLTEIDLQNYINTFVVYDFPEQIRTFNLHQQFTFICNPYQDTYATDTSLNTNNDLYNFQNLYISVNPPVFIGGFPAWYTQSREQFYGVYPIVNNILSIGQAGDGATTTFTGVITNNTGPNFVPNPVQGGSVTTLLQNNVLFSSIDIFGAGLALVDVPVAEPSGNPSITGNLYPPGQQPTQLPLFVDPSNNINYVTGAFTITFPGAPAAGQAINSQTVPVQTAIPNALLFYENQFTLRPVPDQPYRINFEVFARPTALLQLNQAPQLEEWWQYIAYGAAKKIFEDRMDMESVQLIMPEFKTQERLCLRRTIVQNTVERTATIYTEQTANSAGFNGWGYGGGNF